MKQTIFKYSYYIKKTLYDNQTKPLTLIKKMETLWLCVMSLENFSKCFVSYKKNLEEKFQSEKKMLTKNRKKY